MPRPTPEARAIEMLKIAAAVIRDQCPEATHDYDETTCDGLCIADDCEAAAEALSDSKT